MAHLDRRQGSGLRAARDRRRDRARSGRRRAGDRRLLDLQPLPLRARLARPDARGGPRLRRPRRPLPGDQLQRRRAATRPTPSRRWRERVESEGGWPHPYLHDESQEVARAWGAEKTPHVFVLDGDLTSALPRRPRRRLRGPLAERRLVRDALDAVLEGREPEQAETPAVGCGIKWNAPEPFDRPAPPRPRPRLLGQPRAGLRRAGRGAVAPPGARGRGDRRVLGRGRGPRRAARPLQPLRPRLRVAAPGGRDLLPDHAARSRWPRASARAPPRSSPA